MDASKLKPIAQQSEDSSLQTDVFPDEDVGACIWELVRGSRKGELCGVKTFDGKEYCAKHQDLMNIRNSTAENKQESKVTVKESIEIIEPALLDKPKSSVTKSAQERPKAQPKNVVVPSSISVEDMMGILQLFSTTMVEMTKSLREKEILNGYDK
jgi:hypothetical protein